MAVRAGDSTIKTRRSRPASWAGLATSAVICCLTALFAAPADAANATLSLNTTTLTFASADPDLFPVIVGSPDPVRVDVRVRGAFSSQLTAFASGDLRSGSDVIPIANIRWTATGSGFVSGVLSRTSPQLMGMWTGNVTVQGTQQFQLANSWAYATGNYTQTVVYTLVAF